MLTNISKPKQLEYNESFGYSFGPQTAKAFLMAYQHHVLENGKLGLFKMYMHYHYGFGDSGIQIAEYTYRNEKNSCISVELQPACKGFNPEDVELNYVLYSVFDGHREEIAKVPGGREDHLLSLIQWSFSSTSRKFERYEKVEAEIYPRREKRRLSTSIRFKNKKCTTVTSF